MFYFLISINTLNPLQKDLNNLNFILLDSFQLVLVRLTKAPGQEVETKELSLILDDIDHSPKCTAFGREVYLLFSFFP